MQDGKFRVLLLDTKFRNPNHYICIALRDALKRAPGVELVIKADALDAIGLAHKNRCNLFIAFDGEELDQTLCRRLASVCGRSLLWVTEDPYEVSVNKGNAQIFDLVFTNDSASVVEYGDKGRHLPLAGALEFHDLPVLAADKPLRYDLFFAGTAWPNRTAFIRSVLRDMPSDWRFKLALPVNEHLPPRNVDLPDSLISWRTSPPDFARFVNRSAVTILLPRVFSASGNRQFAETPPPRLFEAALAGGVQLVQEALAEAALAFEPEREIVLFSDERDFFRKASQVIGDRDYRNRIATAARDRALRDHTYDRRVESMLAEANHLTMRASDEVLSGELVNGPTARKNVLFVCHNMIGEGWFGGVEIYLDRLRSALGDEFNVLFYAPDGLKNARLLSRDYKILSRFSFTDAVSVAMLSSPEREKAFYSVLVDYRIDFVHFHHFMNHVPALVYIAKSLGVPTAFTVHDYGAVCNEFQLISFNGQFCGAPDVSLAQCDLCLWKKHQIIPGSQAARRAFWNQVLAATDLLIFNTDGARNLLSAMYPAVREHRDVKILPVPILDNQFAARASVDLGNNPKPADRILRVALLGNVTVGKGGDLIAPALSALKGAPVEFHIFGRLDPPYLQLADAEAFSNVIIHGPYLADQLPVELLHCDVSLHVSIWPETYCLTLSEAWQNGIVPIVADIGALGERVEDRVNGIKIRASEEGDLINAIRLLAEDRILLEKLRVNGRSASYETLTPHVMALTVEYRKHFRAFSHADAVSTKGRRVSGIAELGITLESPSWIQAGTAPSIASGGRSVNTPEQRTVNGIGSAKAGFEQRLRARVNHVQAFYMNYGLKKTTLLLAKRAKRMLWMR